MKSKLPLVLSLLTLLVVGVVYFNAGKLAAPNVIIADHQVQICGRNFASFYLKSAPAGIELVKSRVALGTLPLAAFVPQGLTSTDKNFAIAVQLNGSLNLPLVPDMPILPEKDQAKACAAVQKYADNFGSEVARLAVNQINFSQVFSIQKSGSLLKLQLKNNYQAAITQQNTLIEVSKTKLQTLVTEQYTVARARPVYDFLIIYQPGYESEMTNLVGFYANRKVRTLAIAVNQLPGYNPSAPTPAECTGEFAKECYHNWGDPIKGVSQLAVPSLTGFHGDRPMYQQYNRVSYIPGIIRAYIRALKKNNPLRGVLLVGNAQTIPPFNTNTTRHYYDGYPTLNTGDPEVEKLFTDLYYMIPEVPLVLNTDHTNHFVRSPGLWSCRNVNTNQVTLRYWCNSDEWRHWPTPALSAYRNPAHVPEGRIFSAKFDVGDSYWSTVGLESVVPVGRIVTQDRILGGKDPVVARYIAKLDRWYHEMPGMMNNSIHSTGGSTGDSWIFSKEDFDQFKTTFGANSPIYTSEFFVGDWRCAGRCSYKTSGQIMDDLGAKNHVAMHLNGHGGHIAIQAPFANGNVGDSYLSEAVMHLDDGLRQQKFEYPTTDTIKGVEESHRLIGVVFANSCDVSDYLLENEGHYLNKKYWSKFDGRSWAEQWIAMNDGGAMNTFLNGNVGWGGSDNSYNVAWMKKIKSAWESCGTIGDAYRSLILDGLRSQVSGIWSWQTYNRHLLGSPLNHLARLPLNCTRFTDVSDVSEKNTQGSN